MGCGIGFGDDYEKCEILLDEYAYLIDLESNMKVNDKKLEKHNKEKDTVKSNIRQLLEKINQNANGFSQIDKLQKLNEKYQNILTEESKIEK